MSSEPLDDHTISSRFWVKEMRNTDGSTNLLVVVLHCRCGVSFFAEQPWIRGARAHVEGNLDGTVCPLEDVS